MGSKTKHILIFIAIVLFLIGWSVLLLFIPPHDIVSYIGINNGYLIATLLAIIGGVSTLSAASFYATVATLALGGLDPFLLGLLCGPALTLGDWIFYLLGQKGRVLFEGKLGSYIERFSDWLHRQRAWVVSLVVYAYAGLTPFPGDILMVVLALGKYRFRRVLIPILLGNITLVILLSVLAKLGESLF